MNFTNSNLNDSLQPISSGIVIGTITSENVFEEEVNRAIDTKMLHLR